MEPRGFIHPQQQAMAGDGRPWLFAKVGKASRTFGHGIHPLLLGKLDGKGDGDSPGPTHETAHHRGQHTTRRWSAGPHGSPPRRCPRGPAPQCDQHVEGWRDGEQ